MWNETKPGIYQRTIGDNEKFIKFIGDKAHGVCREHWSVTAQAKFELKIATKSQVSEKSHRQAWQALRFEHPSIAVTAEEDTLSYDIPDAEELDRWTKETFLVHREGTCEDAVSSMKPSRFVTAHLLPHKSAILLHFAHWRTDGYGALQLIDSYLNKLSHVLAGELPIMRWGEEVQRLTPSVEDVLQNPPAPTQQILDSTKKWLETIKLMPGSVGLHQTQDVKTAPRGTRSCRLDLTKAETYAIQIACKRHSISLLSAVHASCAALTFAEASADDQAKPYTSTMRFSLRPYLQSPYNTKKFAAALYTGGFMQQVPAGESWLMNARSYQDTYTKGLSDDFLACRRQYAIDVLHILRNAPGPSLPGPSEIDISSVGDAQELLQRSYEVNGTTINVTDINIGVETLTRQMYCFVWTFRDQLGFNLVYNEAFYEPTHVSRMLQRLREILLTELKLQSY